MENESKFWKPEPTQYGLLTFSLVLPILVSVFGFFVIGIFAFAFDSIEVIPQEYRDWLTIVGSALVVLGAEANTPGTFVAVFKRYYKGDEVNFFDWSAIGLSGLGTLANTLIVIALLITASKLFLDLPQEKTQWVIDVLSFAPLLAGIAVSCDYYGSLVELGFHIGSFEKRYEQWLEEKREFEQSEMSSGRQDDIQNQLEDLQKQLEQLQCPVATIQDARKILAGCNGSFKPTKDGLAKLKQKLSENNLRLPESERTALGWLERHEKGTLQ